MSNRQRIGRLAAAAVIVVMGFFVSFEMAAQERGVRDLRALADQAGRA